MLTTKILDTTFKYNTRLLGEGYITGNEESEFGNIDVNIDTYNCRITDISLEKGCLVCAMYIMNRMIMFSTFLPLFAHMKQLNQIVIWLDFHITPE